MVRDTATTAEAMWRTLVNHYQHTNTASLVTMYRRLMTLKTQESQSISQFIDDEWSTTLDQALLSGLTIPKKLRAALLLNAVPDSWRPFLTTQSNLPNLNLATLIPSIQQEKQMRNSSSPGPSPSPSIAMAAGMSS